ncbi:hypothetical protein KP509_04G044000 [Ceratopteris richardii]|uniref:Uncharacterized protein n=1 Tax=Ceratopteris richardii TaxID=49495 RepID=A0A8T2UZF9_CERRI|nr:hypothetical protein KP509_04G044000 [Ceratopteris richardii]KAH7439072.1 hypothetical protein KP509_04G044000 [Ceratopteris richardii]KAH7439073.1 hypothetical protein KP509_04G044000 [Ceratopteris richardii]
MQNRMQNKIGVMATVGRYEREDELALFHEVRKREHERKSNAIHPLPLHEADQPPDENTNDSPKLEVATFMAKMTFNHERNISAIDEPLTTHTNGENDDLLSAELGKNDYDWLLTPPGTPFNHTSCNSASDFGVFVSQTEPLCLESSRTSISSNAQTEHTKKKKNGSLLTSTEVASKGGHTIAITRCSGTPSSSLPLVQSSTKKMANTARFASAARPSSLIRTSISSNHKSNPTIPNDIIKPSSALGSHPITSKGRNTALMASKGGETSVFSYSSTPRKKISSCPAMASVKRVSLSQVQSQPPSAGALRSSSASRVRPQLSRSSPSSRGSSLRENSHDWQQGLSPNSQDIISARASNSSPRSSTSSGFSHTPRASLGGFSHRVGGTSYTKQALFPTSNHRDKFMDGSSKTSSSSALRGKCSLRNMDKRSSAELKVSRNSIQLDRSHGISAIGNIEVEGRWSLGSSVSPDLTSNSKPMYLQERYTSPTSSVDYGFEGPSCRRSLDMSISHLNLHEDSSSGLCSELNGDHSTDMHMIALHSRNGRDHYKDSIYYSNVKISRADQTDFPNFLMKDHLKSLVDSSEHKDKDSDESKDGFCKGFGKSGSCEPSHFCPHGGTAATCDLCSVKKRLQMLTEKTKGSLGASSQTLSES